jgi:protein-S-isoprenylcysteine O-methyltransferase Ste14
MNPQERPSKSIGAPPDTPGVRVPPPVFYLTAILIGLAIDRFIRVQILPDSLAGGVGGTLVGFSFVLAGLGLREFRKGRTTFRVDRSSSALITTGPFRYSRNPMYLSLSILQAGIGFWLNTVWVIALLVPTILAMTYVVIRREEKYLTEKFGAAYRDYRAKVRRWV